MRLLRWLVCAIVVASPLSMAAEASSVLSDSLKNVDSLEQVGSLEQEQPSNPENAPVAAESPTQAEFSDPVKSPEKQAGSRIEIGGEFSGFLKNEGVPYLVKETLVVPEGRALVIEAGVILEFVSSSGLDVQGGSIAVVGEPANKVVMRPAPGYATWNGISITGQHSADLQNLIIQSPEVGIAVENGMLKLENVDVERSSSIGLYARSASVDVQWSNFKFNKGVSLWAASGAYVNMDGSLFSDNMVAILAGEKSHLTMQTSTITRNEFGFVDMEKNKVRQQHTQIEQNRVGLLANDLPADDIKKIVLQNQVNMQQGVGVVTKGLPEEPRNPNAEYFQARTPKNSDFEGESEWTASGKVGTTVGYHGVHTRRDKNGDRYTNYFQVPGLFAELNVYLLVQSTKGRTFEFSANLSADTWNHFDPENVLAVYTDSIQRLAIGNVYLSEGETYLSGMNFLGASYDLNLFSNNAGEPLFVVSAFGGETKEPKLIGDRNPDVFKDYIEDGEAEPQELMVGGKIRWNMHRRFNGTLGFIGSKDYLEDPLFRDGNSSGSVNTSSPVQSSKTFFADGNWLFFPGDVELNGQIAIGAADTANVALHRAINEVFVSAGLDASNLAKIRRLMNNPTFVDLLTMEELEEFFGDNAMMTKSEMQSKLKILLSEAEKLKEEYASDDESSGDVENWDGQNFAMMGSLRWDLDKTVITGHVRFVGSKFYSAGSPDLLQNSREIYGNLDQKVFDFWKLGFNYKLNVENASHGDDYNLFGMAEGSTVGLIPGADEDWLEEHEQDENRTLYEHNANLKNEFKINNLMELSVGYNLNYRTRSTNQRLYASYSTQSGIYDDDWFAVRKGSPVVDVIEDGDTLQLDSVRWAQYYALSDQPYLATEFTERIVRQTINLGFKFNLPKNILRVNGVWTFRTDYSRFEQDDLLSGFDFSDETYGILGYYFHGGDYVEQRYPISVTTNLDILRNVFSVVPRYRIYERYDMNDFEWTVSDNMTVPLSRDFLDLLLSASFRQEFLNWDEEGEHISESEMDVTGSATLQFTHLDCLTSEWTLGFYAAYRPDYLSDEYKDIYGMVSLNYAF